MRVIQISDLHLGPLDHPGADRANANAVAWSNTRTLRDHLAAMDDARELVTVITGDLTDDGHTFPEELDAARQWMESLPGRVFAVPGNHDVGNFTASSSRILVTEERVQQWEERLGPDRFSYARDGHRLLGLNGMVLGSGLPREAEQHAWLRDELDAAAGAGERVWVFQHPPLFLRSPDEVREPRESYWCPPAPARDRLLGLLNRPHVRGVFSGHTHRCFEPPLVETAGGGPRFRWCPALSGTHTEADYFPTHADVSRHALSVLNLDHDREDLGWQTLGLPTRTRWVR